MIREAKERHLAASLAALSDEDFEAIYEDTFRRLRQHLDKIHDAQAIKNLRRAGELEREGGG